MPEMNDALDKVVDILGRQIRKNKTKLEKKIKSGSIDDFVSLSPEINEAEDDDYKIVRKSRLLLSLLPLTRQYLK